MKINIQTKVETSTVLKIVTYYNNNGILLGSKSKLLSLALDEFVSILEAKGLLLTVDEDGVNEYPLNHTVVEELNNTNPIVESVSNESLQAALDKLKELQ